MDVYRSEFISEKTEQVRYTCGCVEHRTYTPNSPGYSTHWPHLCDIHADHIESIAEANEREMERRRQLVAKDQDFINKKAAETFAENMKAPW